MPVVNEMTNLCFKQHNSAFFLILFKLKMYEISSKQGTYFNTILS